VDLGVLRRRRLRVALLAVVLLVLIAADRWEQRREYFAIVHEQQLIESTYAGISDEIGVATEEAAGCLNYVCRNRVTDRLRVRASQMVAASTKGRDSLDGLAILPWHGETANARAAYVDAAESQMIFYGRMADRPNAEAMARIRGGGVPNAHRMAHEMLRIATPPFLDIGDESDLAGLLGSD
jgi:hypothetical protein